MEIGSNNTKIVGNNTVISSNNTVIGSNIIELVAIISESVAIIHESDTNGSRLTFGNWYQYYINRLQYLRSGPSDIFA